MTEKELRLFNSITELLADKNNYHITKFEYNEIDLFT